MINRTTLIFIILVCIMPSIRSDDAQAKKMALEIISSISDDLAILIINKHHQKDPQITKTCCVRLITNLADAIASVIIKIKANKEIRSIELLDQAEYQQALANIYDKLINDIDKAV